MASWLGRTAVKASISSKCVFSFLVLTCQVTSDPGPYQSPPYHPACISLFLKEGGLRLGLNRASGLLAPQDYLNN